MHQSNASTSESLQLAMSNSNSNHIASILLGSFQVITQGLSEKEREEALHEFNLMTRNNPPVPHAVNHISRQSNLRYQFQDLGLEEQQARVPINSPTQAFPHRLQVKVDQYWRMANIKVSSIKAFRGPQTFQGEEAMKATSAITHLNTQRVNLVFHKTGGEIRKQQGQKMRGIRPIEAKRKNKGRQRPKRQYLEVTLDKRQRQSIISTIKQKNLNQPCLENEKLHEAYQQPSLENEEFHQVNQFIGFEGPTQNPSYTLKYKEEWDLKQLGFDTFLPSQNLKFSTKIIRFYE